MPNKEPGSAIGLKIINVMAAVTKVAKDKRNEFHKYDYASDEAIVSAIREEVIKNKLCILPDQQECTQAGDITTVKVKYTILDAESGESIVSQVHGQGQDKGDKGVYKATTGAEKYFLLKTFLIPTGDDPEKEQQQRKPVQTMTVAPSAPESAPAGETTQSGEMMTFQPIDVVDRVSKKSGKAFWKARDQRGTEFFVFDQAIAATLKRAKVDRQTVHCVFEMGELGPILHSARVA